MSLLRRTVLCESPIATLTLVACRHPAGGPSREEETTHASIDLPLSGVFVREVGGTRVVGSAGSVLFYNRGEVHRVSHPAGGGDVCLSLGIAAEALADALGLPPERAATAPFARPHLPADPAWAAALHRLGRRLRTRAATSLEVEETALALARSLAGPLAKKAPRAREETRRRRREAVEAVQLLLAGEPARDWSLADLAREAGCSPFHLSRTFAAEVGVPLHRWAVRKRLVLSLEPVAAGARLADVAFELGFASHAHFSAAFARAFGAPPAAFRAHSSKKMKA